MEVKVASQKRKRRKGKKSSWGKKRRKAKAKEGKTSSSVLYLRGKHGHWGNECWIKNKVRNFHDSSFYLHHQDKKL